MSNNILVNWKVNTDDVAKSRDLLNQANAAANKFQQTAKDGAKTSKDALGQLVAEEKRLETAIKNTTRTSFTSYAAFTKQLQGLSRQYSDVKIKVEQATKAINEQNKAARTTANTLGNIGTTIAAVFSVAALRSAVNFTLEMAKLAGNVEGVKRAFDRLPGSLALLQDLRDATQGTITDFELMKQALQAKNFGLPVQNLAKLLEFATVKAQQTGLSIDYITNSLVTGLGRKSERVFDNLQLDIAELRKRIATGLDFREAGIQLITEDLERMGGVIKTSATEVEILTANFETLRQEVSKQLTSSTWIAGLSEAVSALRVIIKSMPDSVGLSSVFVLKGINDLRKWNAAVEDTLRSEQALKIATEELQVIQKGLGETVRSQTDGIIQEVIARKANIREFEILLEKKKAEIKLNDLLNKGSIETAGLHERNRLALESSLEAITNRLQIDRVVVAEIGKMLQDLVKGVKENGLGLIEAKLAEIEAISDDIKTAKSTQEIHNLNVELEKLNGELEDLKAFGTTKRFLEVDGKIKLVPVTTPKDLAEYKTLLFEGLSRIEGKVKVTIQPSVIGKEQVFKDLGIDDAIKNLEDSLKGAVDRVVNLPLIPTIPMTEWEKIGQEFAENWREITSAGINSTADIINASIQAEADSYDAKLAQSRQYYDRLQELAGDNENAKSRLRLREQKEEQKLRREAFEADKRARKAQTVVNGAAGIIRAFATLDFYEALFASAIIAGETAAQIAVINKTQPRFAKGVIDLKGPGTKTSDSIPAKLSKGESVMTADETGSAGGILRDIRAGKLNDKKLAKQLDSAVLRNVKMNKDGVKIVGMDIAPIVKGLEDIKNSMPDYMEKAGILFKTRQKSENYKQWVRAKTM